MRDYGASTQEQRDSIVTLLCDELEKGLSIRVACDKVGISEAAVYRWRNRAEEGDDEAIQLVRQLVAARARGFEQHVGKIKAAADDDWRAAAWMVDKLYPGWTEQQRRELQQVDLQQLKEEQEEEHRRQEAWQEPAKVAQLCKWAVQMGVVTIEELTGVAPQPQAIEPPVVAEQGLQVKQAVVIALMGGEREQQELTATLCHVLKVPAEAVAEACDRVGVEVVASPGQKTMLRRPNQQRTNQAVVLPKQQSSRPIAQTDSSPTPSSEVRRAGAWFDGGGRGVGDFIREKRG
jgi:hypothetical protein